MPAGDVTLRQVRLAFGVLTMVLLVAAAVTGALLTWRYLPTGPGTQTYTLDRAHRWSRVLVVRHERALALAILGGLIWAGCTVALSVRAAGSSWRKAAAVVGAVAVPVLALVTQWSWILARWDQLSLWSVDVGQSPKGLWVGAFDSHVRFVLVNHYELTPSTYARTVIVHLLAPVFAIVALAIATWLTRAPAPAPTSPPAVPDKVLDPIGA